MLKFVIASALAFLFSCKAMAANIAECSSSQGYTLVFGTGLAKNTKGADTWQADAISQGKMTLTTTEDGKYDLLFIDSFNAIRSVSADGGTVIRLRQTSTSIAILVMYQAAIETYTFLIRDDGKRELLWTATRDSPLMQGVKAMRAQCSYIRIPSGR